jgi:hypothetical protein
MTYTLEISDELILPAITSWNISTPRGVENLHVIIAGSIKARLDDHLEEDESYEEFITELVSIYETEGEVLQEGYSE